MEYKVFYIFKILRLFRIKNLTGKNIDLKMKIKFLNIQKIIQMKNFYLTLFL